MVAVSFWEALVLIDYMKCFTYIQFILKHFSMLNCSIYILYITKRSYQADRQILNSVLIQHNDARMSFVKYLYRYRYR